MNGVPKTDASALATIDYHFMQTASSALLSPAIVARLRADGVIQ